MDTQLLAKLEALDFDLAGSDFTFTDRLVRENGWSREHAKRVIHEYRRFLYLCARAGHPVTPSDAVDQAWHLHLCYTENYWHDLCRDTLGFPLHHGPTKGGSRERVKFHDWYSRTLSSYHEIFGEVPPTDIWPDPKARFRAVRFQRIDRDANFVVPKKLLTRPVFFSTLALLAFGCTKEFAASRDEINIVIIVAIIFIPLIIVAIKYGGRGGGGGNGSSGCGGWGGGCGNSGCGGCGS